MSNPYEKNPYVNNPYDDDDGFVDYGQDTTDQDPFYADWSSDGKAPPLSEEQRRRYYEAKDAYYAERDAYYAERDAYYAEQRRREKLETERETEEAYYRREAAGESRRKTRRENRRQAFSYDEEPPAQERRRRRHRFHPIRTVLFLICLAGIGLLLWGEMPCRNPSGAERENSVCNILLAGTDNEGTRTDTMILLSLDMGNHSVRMLSLPRDTYVPYYYDAPKLNTAYSLGGINELTATVNNVLGFAPDSYAVVSLSTFIRVVDLFGGVDFDVPMQMDYDDPDQNLHIHLLPGLQHLDGEKSMQLVRFRYGYANQDIGRTAVQRDFLREAARQWLRVENVQLLPELWNIYQQDVQTDLSLRNLLWVLRCVLKADFSTMESDSLPGFAGEANGLSVWVLDDAQLAPILEKYNPYY